MSIENFAGNPISSTYQRVVQTDGTYLGDGTGSIINNLTLPGNLIVSGTLYAQNTVVVTQSFSSGSNILGDAVDDFQTLYGTVRIPTGSLTVTGSTISTGGFTGSLFGTASYVPTLAQVTTAGNTTTNAISVGGLTVATNLIYTDTVNGRVGINTASPNQPVHIVGRTRIASSTGTSLHLYNDGTTSLIDSLTNTNAAHDLRISAQNISFYSGASYGTIYAKLFNTGNFALGSNPTDAGYKLDVNGTLRVQATVGISTYVANIINPTNASAQWGLNVIGGNTDTARVLHCGNGTQSILIVKGNRSISINPAVAQVNYATLFVGNAFSGFPTLLVKGNGTTSEVTFQTQNSSGNALLTTLDNGNVLIGTTTDAGYKLDVNGTVRIKGSGTTSATTALLVQNANASASLVVLDNGNVYSYGPGFIASNTAFGFQSLNNPSGSATQNTSFGYQNFSANNYSGFDNVAIGYRAIQNATTGYQNMGIGTETLQFLTTGLGNTAVGHSVLRNITANAGNTGIGLYSLLNLGANQGNSNTGIGSNAFQLMTTGSNNIGIGGGSGAFKSGSFNIFIGASLNQILTGSGNVIIGNNQSLSSSLDNTIAISDGSGNMRIYVSSSGNVGIGTTSPTSRLQVKGSGTTSATTALLVQNSNASSSLTVLDNGYVGINTGSAQYNLDVNGTLRVTGISTLGQTIINGGTQTTSYIDITAALPAFRLWSADYTTLYGGLGSSAWAGSTGNDPAILAGAGLGIKFLVNGGSTPNMTVASNGNVGIGTTSPTAKLHTSGASSDVLLRIDSPATSSIIYVSGSGAVGFNYTSSLTSQATFRGISGNTYFTEINTTTNGSYGVRTDGPVKAANYFLAKEGGGSIQTYTGVDIMTFDSSRNVGISVSSSIGARLHVRGTGTTSATTAFLVQDASGNNSIQTTNDNVTRVGRTSTYANSSTALIVGHKTSNQYATQLVLEPNKDDNTYYKLVLESQYYGEQPFQLYSSNVQTWLYGYGNPMFAQPPAMKIPNQISMGTTDIGKSEISGSVLFIHGQDFYAQAAYTRYTSYSTGVASTRGAVMGLWTGDKLRLWNYENTSVDLGVNNVQRLQVTPSGINVTGSIVATGNLTLGNTGKILSGEFAAGANTSLAMGYSAEANANNSLVVGFISNTDSGADYSAAIGYEARSYLPGQVSYAWGNHTFNARDAGAQQSFITAKNSAGLTTGATMDLSIGGNTITLLGTNRAWMVTMDWISTVSSISGTATGVTVGDTAGGTIRAVVKKVGGVTSVVGTIANDKAADGSLSAVSIAFVVGGSNQLIPRFTGPTFAGGGTVTMKVVGGIKLSETTI